MVNISGFIIDLLLDLAGEVIGHFLPGARSEARFQKHIMRLKEEPWFASLEKDYRYEYIIFQNRKVKRFLNSEKNIKMIISMEEEKERFINMVKEEHIKFTRVY
ncbi:hypothetical protein HPT25_06455 [Bacillus sp. BRMEA1]|nr:hypothetical protein [Neobacillus endophyticus]